MKWMNYYKACLYLIAILSVSGCKNGGQQELLNFRISGQIGESIIDNELKEIQVRLPDTLRMLNIEKIELSREGIVDPLDFDNKEFIITKTKPYEFSVETDGDLQTWKVYRSIQNVEYIAVRNQVGEMVKEGHEQITIYVTKDQPLNDIEILSFKLHYNFDHPRYFERDPYTIQDFTEPQLFEAVNGAEYYKWMVTVKHVD